MIPVAGKDIRRAERMLPRLRNHLTHPIRRLCVVAPDVPGMAAMCRRVGARFIDERGPLTALLSAPRLGRVSGWIRQQMLKLTAPWIMGYPDVVVMDSDTHPLRPVSFPTPDDRQILYRGDRNSVPYHRFTEHLIGPTPHARLSFVAHCMIFRERHLATLFSRI